MESFRPQLGSETLSGKEGGMKQGRGSKEGAVREERKGGKEKKGRTERKGDHNRQRWAVTAAPAHSLTPLSPTLYQSQFLTDKLITYIHLYWLQF